MKEQGGSGQQEVVALGQSSLNEQAAQALRQVLLHCPDPLSPADICSMLQASTALRSVLQQSVSTLMVDLFSCSSSSSALSREQALQRLRSFSAWLPRHSGLVSHLRCNFPAAAAAEGPSGYEEKPSASSSEEDTQDTQGTEDTDEAGTPESSDEAVHAGSPERQLLLEALQACAAAAGGEVRSGSAASPLPPSEPVAAGTAAAPAGAEESASAAAAASAGVLGSPVTAAPAASTRLLSNAQPPPLRLDSFEASLAGMELLQLLPAFHLQALHLTDIPAQDLASPAFCSALASLTALTALSIQHQEKWQGVPVSLVTGGIGQLQGLRELRCSLGPAAGRHLPASLQELSMVLCNSTIQVEGGGGSGFSVCCCDLRRLTALARLQVSRPDTHLHWSSHRAADILLPEEVGVLGVSGLVRLQGQLQPRVQHVRVGGCETALQLSGFLQELEPKSLLCLEVVGTHNGSIAEWSALADLLSRFKSLTRLDLSWAMLFGPREPEVAVVPWCESLAELPDLRHLQLGVSEAHPSDLLHLSTLTFLTHLDLHVYTGLDDATAAAVLPRLTGLQVLSLQGGGLLSLTRVVPALCVLTRLHSVRLICPRGVHVSLPELQAMRALQQLRSLVVPLGPDCTAAAVREWLVGMPCLDSVS